MKFALKNCFFQIRKWSNGYINGTSLLFLQKGTIFESLHFGHIRLIPKYQYQIICLCLTSLVNIFVIRRLKHMFLMLFGYKAISTNIQYAICGKRLYNYQFINCKIVKMPILRHFKFLTVRFCSKSTKSGLNVFKMSHVYSISVLAQW